MANPIGMIVTAVGAAIIAITYLIDKFVGLDTVIKWVGDKLGWLWDKFKRLNNKLPDTLIPDGWKIDTDEAANSVDNLANKLDSIKDKNTKLGITTNETNNQTERNRTEHSYGGYQSGNFSAAKPSSQYQPLSNQTIKSKSEVALTIKSDKPVTVDKAKSEKGIDLNLDVGSLGFSY